MNTECIILDITAPDGKKVAIAAAALRSGKLVAFPTETVYGLGANALDSEAVARIFRAKGRPANNPVIVHVANIEAARMLVAEWPETAANLADKFWPGPLTLVLPKRDIVPEIVTAGGPTVAIRVPAHPVALALLEAAGIPIAAPSANRSMQLSPTTAEHVAKGLSGRIDIILDGGPTPGGIESTVLGLAGGKPILLRPGLISCAEIEAIIGPIQGTTADNVISRVETKSLPSPGMLARHYAPNTPLEVASNGAARVLELSGQGQKVGWLTLNEPPSRLAHDPGLVAIMMPSEPQAYAAQIYAALHRLDGNNLSRIIVDAVPVSEDWHAIRDRLKRASASADES